MIPLCAVVYAEKIHHAPHDVVLIVDASGCENPPPYGFGRGLRIVFGKDGENVVLEQSHERVWSFIVHVRHGLARKLKVQNTGPEWRDEQYAK